MYIIQNAWKSIVRNKGRNILIGIIALVIAVSACVALSIREAAETAKEETLAGMSVTAQISYDRTSAMSDMRESFGDDGFDRENFDFESFTGNTLSLEDYMTYTEALSDGDSYYYSMTASLNAAEDLMPYGENESAEEDSQDNENTPPEGMPGMGGGGREMFDFSARGDFSLTGYSSYSAMLSLFGGDGTYSVTEGQMFEESSSDMVYVVSDELAIYNDLAVGDTITLSNPNYEDETYPLTVCGIYTNTASDTGSSQFAFSDPANNIYLSYDALSAIIDASGEAGNVMTEESGEERSAVLTSEINFTYVFPAVENYNNFETAVRELGLSEAYTITSPDLTSFENSLKPLNTLSTAAGWFFLIVLAIGGIILIVLNIFNLRERKYEVGVLTAIGMKKHKVAIQFVYELFSVTFIAIIIGAAAGAAVSVPVTNKLLADQISGSNASAEQIAGNFGFAAEDVANGSFPGMAGGGGRGNQMPGGAELPAGNVSYIDSVSSATNLVVILELIGVGIFLTVISSLAAMITIMRYEPLKILSSRT